jgi:hypothetical protein
MQHFMRILQVIIIQLLVLDAGRFIADGTTANTSTSNSVFLGYNTKALADSQTNQIVIGDTAVGLGSNTAILGNSSITKTQLQGNVGIGTASPYNKRCRRY